MKDGKISGSGPCSAVLIASTTVSPRCTCLVPLCVGRFPEPLRHASWVWVYLEVPETPRQLVLAALVMGCAARLEPRKGGLQRCVGSERDVGRALVDAQDSGVLPEGRARCRCDGAAHHDVPNECGASAAAQMLSTCAKRCYCAQERGLASVRSRKPSVGLRASDAGYTGPMVYLQGQQRLQRPWAR